MGSTVFTGSRIVRLACAAAVLALLVAVLVVLTRHRTITVDGVVMVGADRTPGSLRATCHNALEDDRADYDYGGSYIGRDGSPVAVGHGFEIVEWHVDNDRFGAGGYGDDNYDISSEHPVDQTEVGPRADLVCDRLRDRDLTTTTLLSLPIAPLTVVALSRRNRTRREIDQLGYDVDALRRRLVRHLAPDRPRAR